MSPRPRRGPYRIALRIYVVTVTAVLATAAALFLVLTLARERSEPPIHGIFRDVARYAAERVSERWPSDVDMRRELETLAGTLKLRAAVYRWDGALVVATDASAPGPLTTDQRDALERAGFVERRGAGGLRGPGDHAIPISSAGERVGYVVIAPPSRPPGAPPIAPELVALALVLVGVGIAAVVLGGTLARPLDRLARTAHALGSGDLAARTGIARRDEVGAVARAFDDMADRMAAVVRGQKELIANIAHELRTPLARIRVALDLAADGDAAVARESLAEIAEDLGELETLVSDVIASARMDLAADTTSGAALPIHKGELDITAVVAQAVERLRQRHPERRIEVEIRSGLPGVVGDPVLLRRVVDNLLDNARKYSPPDREIRVRISRRDDAAVVEVIDQGDGIARDDLDRLFTPFFRADRSRARATGGVGLGLTLSKRIVEAHGGTLVAQSAPGSGTTMAIALPAHGSHR